MLKKKALTALLLVFVLVAAAFSGCKKKDEVISPEGEGKPLFINPLEPPGSESWEAQRNLIGAPELGDRIADVLEINEDVVGWLSIPNTSINAEVLQGKDNDYYLRRNVEKRYSFDGVYFADYRAVITSDLSELSRNLVIYGHSMDENPDSKLFSQLKKYALDVDFAKDNPYIFFSTKDKDMIWEVFAVFYCKTDFKYHRPTVEGDDFQYILDEAKARSEYNYNVDVTTDDHILTLSTCTYKHVASYPNNYRYVVMARLVDEGETLSPTADFEINPSPKAP